MGTLVTLFPMSNSAAQAGPAASSQDTRAIATRPCRTGPLVKNLMALNTPPCGPGAAAPAAAKKVNRHPKTAGEHAEAARQYRAEADGLDATAAGYEQAAATYRNGPMVKNLMAPGTPGRYAFTASTLRDKADKLRRRAAEEDKKAGLPADAAASRSQPR